MDDASYIAVVGGVNVDIGGRSFAPLVPGDSNPGRVSTALGGVGRNIAHNLRLLGCRVGMLTAYGDDRNGEHVAVSCLELGIDIHRARIVPGAATSTYLYLTGPRGEMALAVSDMQVCEAITPDYLLSHLPWLNGATAVVVDANLPEESLRCLAEEVRAPLFCDPVSTAKAARLRPILPRLTALKPNRLEAELLTGEADPMRAAARLLDAGVKEVYLSLGGEGLLGCTQEQCLRLPCIPVSAVNSTGCGDAMTAALVWASLRRMPLAERMRCALAAAAITLRSGGTVAPDLNEQNLLRLAGEGADPC